MEWQEKRGPRRSSVTSDGESSLKSACTQGSEGVQSKRCRQRVSENIRNKTMGSKDHGKPLQVTPHLGRDVVQGRVGVSQRNSPPAQTICEIPVEPRACEMKN